MTIRVLVVDDSRFICKQLQEILEEDTAFQVVGFAHNGVEAVELSARLHPDVITMDVDMPLMDGISAVKKIMASNPCPILMLSALTQVGAKATLDALQAGAIDFLPKQLQDIDTSWNAAKILLRTRVRILALQAYRFKAAIAKNQNRSIGDKSAKVEIGKMDLLVIAASTGGPMAMQTVLSQIPENCSMPILLLQHMPQNFTKSFADRLNQQCHIKVKEAEEGDVLQAGRALLAPGGLQMLINPESGRQQIRLRTKQPGEIYSPCIDITFTSLAEGYKGKILVVVLTGMGADGKEGAIRLKAQGARIWAQDEASSTIYGMPKAIVEANIADKIYSLDEIANAFKRLN